MVHIWVVLSDLTPSKIIRRPAWRSSETAFVYINRFTYRPTTREVEAVDTQLFMMIHKASAENSRNEVTHKASGGRVIIF